MGFCWIVFHSFKKPFSLCTISDLSLCIGYSSPKVASDIQQSKNRKMKLANVWPNATTYAWAKKNSLKEKLAATGHQQKTALYANIWSAFKTKRWCTAQTPSCYAMRSVCLTLRASQKLLARLNAITYTEWMSVYLENSNRGYLFLGGPFALFIKQNCLFNRNLFYWSQLAIRNGPGLPFVIHFHSRGACHKGICL